DFHGRERGRQGARRHEVFRTQADLSVVEVNEVAVADIYCADGNVQLAGIDAIKIAQALECVLEGTEIVVTGLVGRGMRVRKRGGRDARTEETILPIQDGAARIHMSQQLTRRIVRIEDRLLDKWRQGGEGSVGLTDGLPEFMKAFQPAFGRVARYHCCVQRPD